MDEKAQSGNDDGLWCYKVNRIRGVPVKGSFFEEDFQNERKVKGRSRGIY